MAPVLLFDISAIDFGKVQFGVEQIEKINPQRGAMRMLDGMIWIRDDHKLAVAYKDCRSDEFWVPGHIPGRPLLPGVLMIEAAAQISTYMYLVQCQRAGYEHNFLGFTAADDVKFRGQVVPGDRLIILGQEVEFRRRRCISKAQGLVNGTLVFEATITGMAL